MGVHIGNSELLITARHKTFHLDLPKYVSNNLKYKFILSWNSMNFLLSIK